MSWRRYDDKFERHPKVLALIDTCGEAVYYRLMRLHGYAAEFKTNGVITRTAIREARVSPKQLKHMIEVHLIDEISGKFVIHDWFLYTDASISEKVTWYLDNHPDATANEVVKQVGGTRAIVLAEVQKQRSSGSQGGSGRTGVTGSASGSTEPGQVVRQVVHAGARPDPTSPLLETEGSSKADQQQNHRARTALAADKLDMSDPVHRLVAACHDSDDGTEAVFRSITTDEVALDAARDEVKRVHGGAGLAVMVLRRIASGGPVSDFAEPEPVEDARPVLPLLELCEAYVRNMAPSLSWSEIVPQLGEYERRRGELLSDAERSQLESVFVSIVKGEAA